MPTALQILQKYWKHEEFRPLQEEIVTAVTSGKDTFALLPTGGGKSICFQIPALLQPGLCLVVSPLVALMKDQVQNLQQKGIKAIALTGGIQSDEMIELLDNCQFGNYKFLYLSPERLQSDWIVDRIKNLPLNLIAIDEAHCVSQWGHDFRPAYLKISDLKAHFPSTPFLALTASATKRVQQDIITELQLEKPAFFQQSFARKNIAYMVFDIEDKLYRIEQILKKNPEPSIIYVRNRKSCVEVSSQLQIMGFSATYYHGGLHSKEKDTNMKRWMNEEVQVIVATNAFGMGIDKGNVKTVIHIQLPDNMESYYQEAGRSGRNGAKAFAVLLSSPSDRIQAESQFLSVLPDKKFLLQMYVKLCNYFRIGYGEGINESFAFNLNHFCQQYQFPILKTFNGMQFLDRQGIISLTQEFSEKVTARFLIPSREVMRYMSLNPSDEPIVLTILRTYPGIYEVANALNIPLVAKKSKATEEVVLQLLKKLEQLEIVEYHSNNNDATLIFNEVREDDRTINRVSKYLEKQNMLKQSQLAAVLEYVANNKKCKSRQILAYFGEEKSVNCGICSYCINQEKKESDVLLVSEAIINLLTSQPMDSREIENSTHYLPDAIIFALQHLLDNDHIVIQSDNKYRLKKP